VTNFYLNDSITARIARDGAELAHELAGEWRVADVVPTLVPEPGERAGDYVAYWVVERARDRVTGFAVRRFQQPPEIVYGLPDADDFLERWEG
jgi:hypothetical protein